MQTPTLLEAQQRYAQHYLERLSELDERYEASSPSTDGGKGADVRRDLELDWPQLAHAQAWAAAESPVFCAAFALRGWSVLRYLANAQTWVEWFRAALESFPRIADSEAAKTHRAMLRHEEQARGVFGAVFAPNLELALVGEITKRSLLLGLGAALSALGRHAEALTVLDQARQEPSVPIRKGHLGIWVGGRLAGETKGTVTANILNELGLASYRSKHLRAARAWFKKALVEAGRVQSRHMQGVVLGNDAMVLADMGDADQAVSRLRAALRIAEERKAWELMANQLGNLGIIYGDLGLYDLAIHNLDRAKEIHRRQGNHLGEAISFGEIATVLRIKGEVEAARAASAEAVRIAQEAGYGDSLMFFQQKDALYSNQSERDGRRFGFEARRALARRFKRATARRTALRQGGPAVCLAILSAAAATLSRAGDGPLAVVGLVGAIVGAAVAMLIPVLVEYGLRWVLRARLRGYVIASGEALLQWGHWLFPQRARILMAYASWLDWNDQNARAVEVLMAKLSLVVRDADLTSQLAWAIADCGDDLREAELWLECAKTMNPDNPCLFDTEAWLEFRKGNLDAASRLLGEALRHLSKTPEVAFHAGAVLVKLGRPREAVKHLKQALEAPRSFAGLDQARGLLRSLG